MAAKKERNGRSRVDRVVSMLCRGALREQLDRKDWDHVRVAVRVVFETDDFLDTVRPKAVATLGASAFGWLENVEILIEFLAWTRQIAHVVSGVRFSTTPLSGDLWSLRRRHRTLTARLLDRRTREAQRWSTLITLGAIEITLVGFLWDLDWHPPRGAATKSRRRPSLVDVLQ